MFIVPEKGKNEGQDGNQGGRLERRSHQTKVGELVVGKSLQGHQVWPRGDGSDMSGPPLGF